MDCRNSPIARTPPCCLPHIPGVTVPASHPMGKLQDLKEEEEEEKDIAGMQLFIAFFLRVDLTSKHTVQSMSIYH